MNKIIITILAGIAIGILIAPAKGSVTRKRIEDGFDDMVDSLMKLADKITPEGSASDIEADLQTPVPKPEW